MTQPVRQRRGWLPLGGACRTVVTVPSWMYNIFQSCLLGWLAGRCWEIHVQLFSHMVDGSETKKSCMPVSSFLVFCNITIKICLVLGSVRWTLSLSCFFFKKKKRNNWWSTQGCENPFQPLFIFFIFLQPSHLWPLDAARVASLLCCWWAEPVERILFSSVTSDRRAPPGATTSFQLLNCCSGYRAH